jgi:hypothetical protein
MQLIIGDPIPSRKKPNSYEVDITTVAGDGDGYDHLLVGPFVKGDNDDEVLLEDLLLTINRIANEHPRGMLGSDNYDAVEGFLSWFSPDNVFDETTFRRYNPDYAFSYEEYVELHARVLELSRKTGNYLDWTMDPMTDYQTPRGYSSHKVLYYDNSLVQHEVAVS